MINNKYFNVTKQDWNSINIIELTASTVYNKPSNLHSALVVCIAAGGGGGSGGAGSGQMRGAGAGGGGALASRLLMVSALASTGETVTIGAGGAGGAAKSSGTGNVGSNGTATSFGDEPLVYADFGLGGNEGRVNPATASGDGGNVNTSIPNYFINTITGGQGGAGGSNGNTTTNNSNNDTGRQVAGSCGGSGGGHRASYVNSNGARSGICYDYTGGTHSASGGAGTVGNDGGTGQDNVTLQFIRDYPLTLNITKGLGTGGGGGGNCTDLSGSNAGNGGNGGLYGAGGGGGGSLRTGAGGNSGAGGTGAQGLCVIIEYLK